MDENPKGKRFTHVYFDRGTPQKDSIRFRTRLASFFDKYLRESLDQPAADGVAQEIGVRVPTGVYGIRNWRDFFERCEARDLLDLITIVSQIAARPVHRHMFNNWIEFVRRALAEENLCYSVDDQGGVHFTVDQEFAHSRMTTVRRLGDSRFGAVRHAFESSAEALDQPSPDTLKAVRAIYDAQETLFKLMFPNASRLGPAEIKHYLMPRLTDIHPSGAALEVSKQLLNSWSDWVVALQQYRHADRTAEPSPPPTDLAVALISTGTDFLRWLLDIETSLQIR